MTNQDLGYTESLENYRIEKHLDSFELGRVILEHKDRYSIKSNEKEYDAELIGNLRYTAESRADLPAVGDWVAFTEYDQDKALIHAVYPRYSVIERQAVGKSGEKQIIAANIDFGLIVQSVNRDFNINRLERYLTICNDSNVEPMIVLSKIDLITASELETLIALVKKRVKQVLILPISNQSTLGLDQLSKSIKPGKTYCLLGSSGVGKSTLLNHLTGQELMITGEISTSIDRGKHITSHRELVVLENGGILIDNPGMREVGISDSSSGLEITFESIYQLAQECKFSDCSHTNEKGCAILEAVEAGEIDIDSYENFLKMERERAHFESTIEEKRSKDKNFGKMIRNVKKERGRNKY